MRELVEGGLLLSSRALAAGWSRATLARRLRSEGWTPVRQGVWSEPRGDAVGLGVRLRTTQLVTPRLVVSHRSAARLWGIETLDTSARGAGGRGTGRLPLLEFTDPALTFRQRLPDARVHRIPLDETDVVRLGGGLRVTDVGRTVADLLRRGPRDDAVVAVESALGYRRVDGKRRPPLITPAAVELALEAPLLGRTRARTWWRLADRGAGSPAETLARLRMLDAGLHPETQAEVRTARGRRRYLDFLFRAEGVAVEIEGYAYHGSRDAHRRDMARFNEILGCPRCGACSDTEPRTCCTGLSRW